MSSRLATYDLAMRRLDSALLVLLGVLVAHQIAYLTSSAVGYETSIAHGHLKVAWLLGSVGLLATLARFLLSSLRRRKHDPGNVLHLAGAIAGGYLLMEEFERATDGYGLFALFHEPVFWFGLAAAPLVAIALSWSLRSFEAAVSRFIEGRADAPVSAPRPSCSLAATSLVTVPTSPLSFAVCRRGPPIAFEFS